MSMLDEYSRAKSKLDKTGVLATVVAQIRAKSPNGGFVKQDENDRWFEVRTLSGSAMHFCVLDDLTDRSSTGNRLEIFSPKKRLHKHFETLFMSDTSPAMWRKRSDDKRSKHAQ